MTKILLVDDEPAMSRGLSRAILLRRPDYTVLTALGGAEAIELLEGQHFDLVVTDLQMAGGDGFELLAWLVSQRPQVVAFAMSAFCDEQAQQRLQALGGFECFAKPLDVPALMLRLQESMAQTIRGQIANVGLASFMQLVELEQKTCTLEVRHQSQVGKLFMRKGELLDACTGTLSGEPAALEILSWANVDLTIEASSKLVARTIWKPAHYVVMEAMRLRDEGSRTASTPVRQRPSDPFGEPRTTGERLLLTASMQTRRPAAALQMPVGALALLVVELGTGLVVASDERALLDVSELARTSHALVQQESATLSLAAGSGEALEELVLLTSSRGELIKPLPASEQFVLLVFDASQTNLVMARHELDRFITEYLASAKV